CQYTPLTGCFDSDIDGYDNCNPPEGDISFADCDDSNATVWRDVLLYVDLDHDNWGNSSISSSFCIGSYVPSGWANDIQDCNDNNININPSAVEICGDRIDQDCVDSDLLCVTCVDSIIPYTGCNCGVPPRPYYTGYCCISGWSEKPCEDGDILQPSPKRVSFWELVLKRFFLF
nr:hypothetical protein [Nanoarchaeum sp.]